MAGARGHGGRGGAQGEPGGAVHVGGGQAASAEVSWSRDFLTVSSWRDDYIVIKYTGVIFDSL